MCPVRSVTYVSGRSITDERRIADELGKILRVTARNEQLNQAAGTVSSSSPDLSNYRTELL